MDGEANFSVEMYRKIGVGICRPGLGVITDLLTIGAWPVAAYEKRNREMKHNASVLKTHGLGDESDTDHVIDIAKTHMENTLARRKFIEKRCELLGLDMRVY